MPIFAAFIILGCVQNNSNGSGGNAKCGATLSGPTWTSSCQTWADTYCCSQLEACVSDPNCASLLACMEGCAGQSGCADACAGQNGSSALPIYQAFATCTQSTPSNGPAIPASCNWPS